jgi:thiol-disulfide isomerase/thioredoxin
MFLGGVLLAGMVSLPLLAEQDVSRLISSHQGRILVVNFWATWCGPCREEFPELVRLKRDYAEEELVLVTVSMDEPEDSERALEFLQEQGVGAPAYMRAFRDFEAFVNAFDPSWSGALPATFIYDRAGRLSFSKFGQTTFEELSKQVDGLLVEKKGLVN